MANGLQNMIYNLANAVPLAVMTALARWLEFKTWCIPIILLAGAVAVTVLFIVCFYYEKYNCSTKSINVSKTTSKDFWAVAYVITYVLPFAYMVMPNYHVVSLLVAGLMLVLVIAPAIIALPNILLVFAGYHFYELETENTGIGDYMLISSKRRRIRNKADIKIVIRVFERLLIDAKGR